MLKRPFFYLSVFFTMLVCFHPVLSNEYQKGWDAYLKNDIQKAITFFTDAKEDENTAAKASLMLAYIGGYDFHFYNEYEEFQEFIEDEENASPYIMAFWFSSALKHASSDYLEELIDDPKIHNTLKVMAYEKLSKQYIRYYLTDDCAESVEMMGSVNTWQAAGVFDNISGSGFDKNYAPIANPKPDKIFKNKVGLDIQWRDIPASPTEPWIRLDNFFNSNNSIIFAQNFCNSPTDQEVHIKLGVSGSIKVWVNDQLLLAEEEEQDSGVDNYIITAKLHKGYNRILIQMGESDNHQTNFLMRITDPMGMFIEDLTYTTEYHDYQKETNFKSKSISNFAEDFFKEEIKKNPKDMLNYLLLLELYLMNDKTELTKELLTTASKIAPDFIGLMNIKLNLYSRTFDKTSLSLLQGEIKTKAPKSKNAYMFRLAEYQNNEDFAKAEAIIDSLSNMTDNDVLIYSSRIDLYAAQKKNQDFADMLFTASNEFRFTFYFEMLKSIVLEEGYNQPNRAIRNLEFYIDYKYNQTLVKRLISLYLKYGQSEKAIEILEGLVENFPNDITHYDQLASLYFNIGDYDDAMEYWQKALSLNPNYGYLHGQVARCNRELDEIDESIASFKTSLKYNPHQFGVRKEYRELIEKKEIFEYFEKPNLDSLFKHSPNAEDYPEDQSIYLHKEIQKVAYKDRAIEEKHYIAIKIFDVADIDKWKEYKINSYRNQKLKIEKAEVVKKNGSKVKAEVNNNLLVFTSLEEGDGIIIVYKQRTYTGGKLANFLDISQIISSTVPKKHFKYSLLIDSSKTFKHKLTNSDLKPTIESKDEFKQYTWALDNVESIKSETFMPSIYDQGMVLHINSVPDWDIISKWYHDITRTKTKVSFEVKELVTNLLKGKENLSDKEKVAILYEYIVKDIRYSSIPFRQSGVVPQTAAKTIITKIGDCKDVVTLFASMCNAIGKDVNYVLYNSRAHGKNRMVFPSSYFEHVIAKINLDSKDYYVELTSDALAFSTLSNSSTNAYVLEINGDKDKKQEAFYLNPASRLKNLKERTINVTFQNDDILVNIDTKAFGAHGAKLRGKYRDIGKKAREKAVTASIRVNYSKINLKSYKFDETLENFSPFVSYSYSYIAKSPMNKISNLMLLELPWCEHEVPRDFLTDEKRTKDLEYWAYNRSDGESAKLNIEIPTHLTLSEVPETEIYTSKFADYKMEFVREGNMLKVTREMTYKKDLITIEEYPEFRVFIEKVIKSDQKQIAFEQM